MIGFFEMKVGKCVVVITGDTKEDVINRFLDTTKDIGNYHLWKIEENGSIIEDYGRYSYERKYLFSSHTIRFENPSKYKL